MYYVISICKFYVSFKICNQIKLVYFSKLIVWNGREKTDVSVDWIL
jgi:hypothetical protein